MSYYKSNNPQEQINEAIQILRQGIAREYCKENAEYRANREKLKSTIIPTLKVKLNLKDKVFHSSQRRYELILLERKREELRQKNEELISANPRVQLAESIRSSMAQLDSQDIQVGVFAVEQLLQEQSKMRVPGYIDRREFNDELYKTDVGIRKLDRAKDISAQDFQLRRDTILEQFNANYDKHIYSDDIVTQATAQFGENSQAVIKLKSIHDEIVEMMRSASSQVPVLQNEILDELERYGITTGLDTGFQTFWKGFKEKAKSLFNRVFHREETGKLESATGQSNIGNSIPRRNIRKELQNFTPNTQQPPESNIEPKEQVEILNDGIEPNDD